MDIQKRFGHFGMMVAGVSTAPGDEANIPFIILRKTSLRYWDDARDEDDKEDKTKADVGLAYINDDWVCFGWTDPTPEQPDLEKFGDLLCDKLNER